MFRKLQNIDTAFRYVRMFTLVVIAGCTLVTGFALYKSFALVNEMEDKVYVLANGKALEAYSSSRNENVPVEARDHVKTFHKLFFTLDPDHEVIKANVVKALYLADHSAKREYDNIRESGYYANIISGNISQQIRVDSVSVSTDDYPYFFRCHARQFIIRTTSTVTRSLVTEGYLRNVSRSDNNPHGFLIERWLTLENKDLKVENR